MRILSGLMFGVICSLCVGQFGFAQESRVEVLRADDNFPIYCTYYPATDEGATTGVMNAPVVVLLHGENGSRLQWDKQSGPRNAQPFPVELQKRGFAVLSVDLRKHGESVMEGRKDDPVRPNDYKAMVLGDLVAVKTFIFAEHQARRLNMAKTAIIATGISVPLAVAFTEVDWKQRPYDDSPIPAQRTPRGQDVKCLGLLSPEANAGTIHSTKSLNTIRNLPIAVMIVAGEEDNDGSRAAKSMHQVLSTNKKNEELVEYLQPKVKFDGLDLMNRDPRIAYIPLLKFLDDHAKSLEIPWQDRRSRIDR